MNISSPTTFETRLDELYPTSCYNCSNDCPRIILEIFKESEPDWDNLTWEERQDYNLRIYEVFNEKNYNSVNMRTCDFISMLPHLSMYKREAKTLATELASKGYDVEIIPVPTNRFKAIAIIYKDGVHIHPASLINVFKTIRVRGGKK